MKELEEDRDWLESDQQYAKRKARSQPLKEHRVIGPPGTGKTSYLARQAPIAAGKYGIDGVLLSSLTKTAALEIAGRHTSIPREMIGTLHSHCLRALDRPALAEIPEGISAWNDHVTEQGWPQRFRMEQKQSVSDLDHAPAEMPASMGGETDGDTLRSRLATHRARMTNPSLYDPDLHEFAERWAAWKQATDRADFTDLIERCINQRVSAPNDPAVIMLDEAQDYSRLEMTLARQWAEGCEQLVTVADPNQCLFGWRGADPETLFDGDAASERVLEQSYRVPRTVHEYAVNWIRQMPGYREFAYKPRDEDGQVRRLIDPGLSWVQPDQLIGELEASQRDGTVMVLASCGYMLNPLIARLRERGIPFANPWRPQHGGWNPMRGAERLLAFLRPDQATWGDESRFWTFGDLRRWIDPLKAKGLLSRGAKTWLEAKNLVNRFGETAEEQPASFSQVIDLFASESVAEHAINLDVEWWLTNHLPPRRAGSEYSVQIWRKHGGSKLREKPGLFVGTVHSFKGSEADSCFLYPDLSRAAYATGRPVSGRLFAPSAATYRVFYVAMTRARQSLTVLPASGVEFVPLPYPSNG